MKVSLTPLEESTVPKVTLSPLDESPTGSRITLTPLEDETNPPVPTERPSNIIKQGIAGVTDIGTYMPGMLGMAGSAIEALGKEGKFLDNFNKAMESGTDRDLIDSSQKAREWVNEKLGIKDAVSTEDQIARLVGGFLLPVPGAFLGGAAATGVKGALGKATTFLAPTVRMGPGFAKRAATSVGVGAGIDQGTRAYVDSPELPLMFSEKALTGKDPLNVSIEPLEDGFEARRAWDEKIQKNADYEDYKMMGILGATALGSYAALKYAQHLSALKIKDLPNGAAIPEPNALEKFGTAIDPANVLNGTTRIKDYPGVLWEANKQGLKDADKYINEQLVDANKAVTHTMVDQNYTPETVNRMVNNTHLDPRGMAQGLMDTGEFPLDLGVRTHAVNDLDIRVQALGPDDKKVLDNALISQSHKAHLQSSNPATIWGTGTGHADLDAAIAAGRNNPAISQLMDDISDVYVKHLDARVKTGVMDSAEAARLKGHFSLDHNGTHKAAYYPMYGATSRTVLEKVGKALGITRSGSREVPTMQEMLARSLDMPDHPLDTMSALRQYTVHNVDDMVQNQYKRQALSYLSSTRINPVTNKVEHTLRDPYTGATRTTDWPEMRDTGRNTVYIGKGKITGDGKNIHIIADDKLPRGSRHFKSGHVDDVKKSVPEGEIVEFQHKGELHLMHVPDPALRAAMNINKDLSSALQFMNHWKSVFTKFTTGKYSPFAPFSHAYQSSQTALNTTAREGLGAGIKSIGQGLKGSQEIFIANAAKEISQYLAYRLATNTGLSKFMPPQAMQRLQGVLERRFKDSILTPIRGETGRQSSSLQANQFLSSVSDFADAAATNFGSKFGMDEMKLLGRMWEHLNTALHEGSAFGAEWKYIGQLRNRNGGAPLTGQDYRDAVGYGKSIAGDVRKLGASKAAEVFNASVPFSGAMIQSWNSIGSAIRSSPNAWAKFTMGAGAIIGVPTVSELVWNNVLSMQEELEGTVWTDPDDPSISWTRNDYYWNGFTTKQRTDNFIVAIPGSPPWESILIPVAPEMSLFKAVVTEAMDAVFGFSAVGNIKVAEGGADRSHIYTALGRIADVPLPPLVAAAFSYTGADVSLGLAVEESNNPNDPNAGTTLIRNVPLGAGERVTGTSRTRFVGQTIGKEMTAIIQDIFGAGGATFVAVYEAFNAGKISDKADSVTDGISFAADAFGDGLLKQARYLQPIFGKAMSPNANDEIAKSLYGKRQTLKTLQSNYNTYYTSGLADKNMFPSRGNTDVPIDDPLNYEMAADAGIVEKRISKLDKEISALRVQSSKMGNAANLGGITGRKHAMDSNALKIQTLKAIQLAELVKYEQHWTEVYSERYRRPININLSDFGPRPNHPTDSISKALGK